MLFIRAPATGMPFLAGRPYAPVPGLMIKAPDVTLLYVIVAFVAVYAIARRYLFEPLSAILDERQREEREAAALHAEGLRSLEAAVSSAERSLALARGEALKAREALRAEGRAHLEARLAQTRRAAEEAVLVATNEIRKESSRSSAQLPERSRSLARQLAEKILGRKIAA